MSAVGSKVAQAATPRYTVLVASSNPHERETWAALLSHPDFSVLVVNDGEAALRIVRHRAVDVVVAAITMAKMDGLELLRDIREYSPRPEVILIAKGRESLDRVYLKAGEIYGAAATYTQPLEKKEFLLGVRVALGCGGIASEEA